MQGSNDDDSFGVIGDWGTWKIFCVECNMIIANIWDYLTSGIIIIANTRLWIIVSHQSLDQVCYGNHRLKRKALDYAETCFHRFWVNWIGAILSIRDFLSLGFCGLYINGVI
jgi:hypothetical protein